jgi:sigma-B regulation protein RsbU (phosphoserine phosphatase)
MEAGELGVFRSQLIERRDRIEAVRSSVGESPDLARLLGEVDAALERVEHGTYGICEACHDTIEKDALAADPLITLCIDHLNANQRRALEHDLELASAIQTRLLPDRDLTCHGWTVHYRYQPAGPVSGDFCDLAADGDDRLFFAVGDASGKGVAASLLMSHLHATFRTLLSLGTPADDLMRRANRLFCDSTLASHYATAVCGFAHRSGEIEIANAGHCPPLVLRRGGLETIPATGLPLGLFCGGQYSAARLELELGDALILYTDGITEARNPADLEYGPERLAALLPRYAGMAPQHIATACLEDFGTFLSGASQADDVTLMVIGRQGTFQPAGQLV